MYTVIASQMISGGGLEEADGGLWATVALRPQTTPTKRCLPLTVPPDLYRQAGISIETRMMPTALLTL